MENSSALLGFVLVASFIAIPRLLSSRSMDKNLASASKGQIKAPPLVTATFAAIAFGFFLFNFWALFQDLLPAWVPILGMLMFGYVTYAALFSVSAYGVVSWDERGITGPNRLLPLPFANNRSSLAWDDLAIYREDRTQSVQVFTKDNRKLVWSNMYTNAQSLKERIRGQCPDIVFQSA